MEDLRNIQIPTHNYKSMIILDQEASLNEILAQLINGDTYRWRVLWISGFGKTANNTSVMVLEEEINNSIDGILCDWNILFDFTKGTLQLHEFLLIGDTDSHKLHRYENEEDMQAICEFYIQLIDSTYWEINSSNLSFMNNIEKNLKGKYMHQ